VETEEKDNVETEEIDSVETEEKDDVETEEIDSVETEEKDNVAVNQYLGTGRRKTSVARVRLIPNGSGNIFVNKKPIDEYFNRQTLIMIARQPLVTTKTHRLYDVYVNSHGGGTTGQAGAIRHGISRALVKADESLRTQLRKGGFLTRDSRMRERKKYGQKGARARFQFSKR